MMDLKKSFLIALIIAGCLLAFTGTASANSITLSKSPGISLSSYTISSTFTVTVFANLSSSSGAGQDIVGAGLTYNSAQLTAIGCSEFNTGTYFVGTAPSPHFAQVVNGVAGYEPFSDIIVNNCGAGAPGNGGLTTPGIVDLIAQQVTVGVGQTSGTIKLGTVTFHLSGTGTFTISAIFGAGGFIGSDFVNRTTGALGSLGVTVIPEPTTIALMGLGVLGLGLSGRRLRRR